MGKKFSEQDRDNLAKAIIEVTGDDEIQRRHLINLCRKVPGIFKNRTKEVNKEILEKYLVIVEARKAVK